MKATKLLLFTIMISLALSSYSYASIKDKKAMRESEKNISTAIENVKAACGNATLEASVDWSNWSTYDYKEMRSKKSDVIRFTGGLAESVLTEMVNLCKDADYKEELAKITNLNFAGKEDQESRYVEFKLNENILEVYLNADGVTSWKTEKLLKAVWD